MSATFTLVYRFGPLEELLPEGKAKVEEANTLAYNSAVLRQQNVL